MGEILLSAQGLCSGYGAKNIISGVNVNFECGKVTVIVGPNGCGKSTLLKTLIRLITPTSGLVIADGKDAAKLTSSRLARVAAYLPQKKNIPDLTVMTMVLHGRFAHLSYPRRYRKEDISIAKDALRTVELSQLAEENMSDLSGGTQQRVFLAMTLAQNSPVILMDEPTSFMDISYQIKFMELSRKLADGGKAMVMVLHDLPAALRYADEMMVMSDGKVAACGTPEEIFKSKILDSVFQITIKRALIGGEFVYYC